MSDATMAKMGARDPRRVVKWCNVRPSLEERIWSWRPLRNALSTAIAHAKVVEVCNTGFTDDALQVKAEKIEADGFDDVVKALRQVPNARRVPAAGAAVFFEVVLPSLDGGDLTWTPREPVMVPARPEGEQPTLFDETVPEVLMGQDDDGEPVDVELAGGDDEIESALMGADAYQVITDRIVAALEKGTIPWRKPWRATAGTGVPQNAVSHRPYNGINLLLLGMAPYTDPRWLTFKQAGDLGGHVRQGEKGTQIIFWKIFESRRKVDAESTDEGDVPDADENIRTVRLLRYYTVFNVEQCDGLKLPPLVGRPVGWNPLVEADRIMNGYPNPPRIDHKGGDQAFYLPARDEIHLPTQASFRVADGYYATVFHEMGHSTGHPSRLNRHGEEPPAPFGSPSYSREELIAEFCSAYLCAEAGIDSTVLEGQSAAYIKGWLRPLRNDAKFVIIAAGKAQRAANWILGRATAGGPSDATAPFPAVVVPAPVHEPVRELVGAGGQARLFQEMGGRLRNVATHSPQKTRTWVKKRGDGTWVAGVHLVLLDGDELPLFEIPPEETRGDALSVVRQWMSEWWHNEQADEFGKVPGEVGLSQGDEPDEDASDDLIDAGPASLAQEVAPLVDEVERELCVRAGECEENNDEDDLTAQE